MNKICTDSLSLERFANSLDSGHLKAWKAFGIVMTLNDIPAITSDNVRLLKYLTNSLEMEGFRGVEIEKIQRWVIENIA